MADGGSSVTVIPTLRLSFKELEETAEALKKESNEKEDDEALSHSGDVRIGGRGILHIKPTISVTSKSNTKKSRKDDASFASNSAVDEICVDTTLMKLASSVPVRSGNDEHQNLSGENKDKRVGSSRQRNRPESRKSKEVAEVSKPSQRLSRSAGDQRGAETSQPSKGSAGVKVELRRLLLEWDRLESRRVERSLAKWNGDIAKLASILEFCKTMWQCTEEILSRDVELFSRQNLTVKLWKGCIYPVIEKLRVLGTATDATRFHKILHRFLSDVNDYYSRCLQLIQSNLNFRLSALATGSVQFTSKTQHREVMVAAVMCHNWYIYLGDVARYQQQLLASAGSEINWTVGSEVNWSKPRHYYLKAQQLVPKDGKPYNQLAVVAVNSHRRLDAVYYYMRSLATVPPFQSAYDSLVAIFAETGQKAQRKEEDERMAMEREAARAARRQRKTDRLARKKEKRGHSSEGDQAEESDTSHFASGRKEVWLLPGAVALKEQLSPQANTTKEGVGEEMESSSVKEELEVESNLADLTRIAKKVTSLFLVVHGKLFSRTGGDSVGVVEGRLLDSLGKLLKGPFKQDLALLLFKMAVINIYAIHHALETRTVSSSQSYFHCGRVLRLAIQVTQLLFARCSQELGQHQNEQIFQEGISDFSNSQIKSVEQEVGGEGVWSAPVSSLDVLSVLLPAARLLLDWFMIQEKVASHCVATLDQALQYKFWSTVANFLNTAAALGIHSDKAVEEVQPDMKEGEENNISPRLWEDRYLAGFMPLKATLGTMETFTLPELKRMTVKEHHGQVVCRITLLRQMWYQLCSRPLVTGVNIGYDTPTNQLLVLDKCRTGEEEEEVGLVVEEEEEEEEELIELDLDNSLSLDFSDDDIEYLSDEEVETRELGVEGAPKQEMGGDTSDEIQLLKAQRADLTRQLEEREQAEAITQTVLHQAVSRSVEVVHITPSYLVPDTNCYVDQLPDLQELVQTKDFILAVPLVVLAELEGLSKGAATTAADSGRLERLSSSAKKAVEYIRHSFQAKCPQLRALTTQGSLLPSLAFRAEVTEKMSNDDLILNSCLQLHLKTKSSTKSGGIPYYKVVLLTDDRNLRVKAHAAGQPVKEVSSFMTLLRNKK